MNLFTYSETGSWVVYTSFKLCVAKDDLEFLTLLLSILMLMSPELSLLVRQYQGLDLGLFAW